MEGRGVVGNKITFIENSIPLIQSFIPFNKRSVAYARKTAQK